MELITNQYDHDMEAAVLGAIMLEKDALILIGPDYGDHLFHDPRHKVVAKAISELQRENQDIDILTVTVRVKQMGQLESVTGFFISQLTNRVASSANIIYHTRILQQFHLLRSGHKLGQKLISKSIVRDCDPFDLIANTMDELDGLLTGVITKQFDTPKSMVNTFLEDLHQKRSGKITAGLPYGLDELDGRLGGTVKTDFIVLAGRPGQGKTALLIKKVRTVAIEMRKPVVIFSLEMSSLQLLARIASAECQINSEQLRKGKLTDEEMSKISKKMVELSSSPIYIDDTPGIEIHDLRNRARRLKMQHGIEEIYVDYIQLIKARLRNKNANREQEVSYISKSLKELAKELDVPVIALSQLNRDVEKRSDRRPMLSDLRESGSLEQDADLVLFIYRPEYYGITEIECNGKIDTSARRAVIVNDKNRHGATDDYVVGFAGEYTEFFNVKTF